MKHTPRWLGALVLAALAGACGEGAGARGGISPTAPRLSGATTHVTVNCPTTMEYGTSATCTAYGYDSTNVFTSSNVTSWTSANTSLATITSGGVVTAGNTTGTDSIRAVIDGVTGVTAIRIVAPLSVTLNGPTSQRPNAQCFYSAQVTGGIGAYSYSWTQQSGSGSSDGDNGWFATAGTVSFRLTVTVTDGASRTATASRVISVSSSAPVCLF